MTWFVLHQNNIASTWQFTFFHVWIFHRYLNLVWCDSDGFHSFAENQAARHKHSRYTNLHIHTLQVRRLPKLSHAGVRPVTLFANQHSDLSKQSVTSSSMYLTWLCAGVWSYSWQAVTLCCSVHSANLLHRSSCIAHACIRLCDRPASRAWREDSEPVTCCDGRPYKAADELQRGEASQTLNEHIKLIPLLRWAGFVWKSPANHAAHRDSRALRQPGGPESQMPVINQAYVSTWECY